MSELNPSPTPYSSASAAYLLLTADAGQWVEPEAFGHELRRIGLQPVCGVAIPPDFAAATDGPAWQIRFGQWIFLTGLARQDGWLTQSAAGDFAFAGSRPPPAGANGQKLVLTPVTSGARDSEIACTRALLKVAVLLADMTAADHVFWLPAKLWSDISNFRLAVTEMLDSGMPPLLHLVAFIDGLDGAIIATRGLSFFCDQELRLTKAEGLSRPDQVRRLARLSLDMMMNGSITAQRSFPGLVAGETIHVEPREAGVDGGETPALLVRIEQL